MDPSRDANTLEGPPETAIDLYSVAKLEALLGTDRNRLYAIAERAGSYYRPFPKREKSRPFPKKFKVPKKSLRLIDNPQGELKDLQSKINAALLRPLRFPRYICGGVPGKTILDNVLMHLGAPVLVTLDVRSFFPSITNRQVYNVWRNVLNCSPKIARILTRLTTFERRLPQGAPTSTPLANLVLLASDQDIRRECAAQSVTYSTWVDDLAFSGENARDVINTAVACLRTAGLSVSHRKLKIMGPGTRKTLTGVLLAQFPGVLPERLARLRSGIHKLSTGDVNDNEVENYASRLQGGIAYVASIDPRKGAKLATELRSAMDSATSRG
jgi:RNA-directed DNA polymerase